MSRDLELRMIRLERDARQRQGTRYVISSWPTPDDDPDAPAPAEPDGILTDEEWEAAHCEPRRH
jgi:hypothetical protein